MAIELPTEKTLPVDDVGLTTMLLYGPPKIGKSTIANSFPEALFVATEEGLKFQESYKVGISNWEDFKELCAKLRKEKHRFKSIVIDTADLLFKVAEDYICKKHGIEHPSDLEYGKGWGFLRDEFQKAITPLAVPEKTGEVRFGLLFISHARDVEVKGRIIKTHRTVCTLSGTARKVLLPLVDCIGYCGFKLDAAGEPTKERIVTFEPSEQVEAGDRTGKLPAELPMLKTGWYASLQAAYRSGRPAAPKKLAPKKKL